MANSAPVAGAVTGTLTYTEIPGTTGSGEDTGLRGSIALSDPDGDLLTAQYQRGNTTYGTLTWSGGTLTPSQAADLTYLASESVQYTSPQDGFSARGVSAGWYIVDGALDFLGEGETLTYQVAWRVSDGTDATTASMTFVATGTNDRPVFGDFGEPEILELEGTGYSVGGSLMGTISVSDPDANDGRPTLSVPGGTLLGDGRISSAGTYGTLVFDPGTGDWTYTPDGSAIEGLGSGEVAFDNFEIVADDGNGGIASETFSVKLTGTNDVPTAGPVDGFTAYTEAAALTGSAAQVPLNGTVWLSDLDGDNLDGSFLSGNVQWGNLVWSGGTLSAAQLDALDTIVPSRALGSGMGGQLTTANASVAWSMADGALDFLSAGETLTLTATFRVTDGTATTDVPIVLTVTGSNDKAVLVTSDPTLTSSAVDAVVTDLGVGTYEVTAGSLTGTITATDPDLTEAAPQVSLLFGGVLPDGRQIQSGDYGALVFDPATGAYEYTPDVAKVDALGAGVVEFENFNFVTRDGVSTALTVKVVGTNDTPTLAAVPAGTVTELRGATGYALDRPLSGTLVGSDPEGGALTFGFGDAPAVNGVIESTDVRGTFRLEVATGAYSFTPSAAWVEHFRDGTVAILTVPFTVSDGQGGVTQATWDITFFGADERIAVTDVADQAAREGQAFSFTLPAGTFTDPEGDALALGVSGLPDWLSFDPLTRTFSGTPPAGAGDGAVTVTVTASDGASSVVEDTAEVSFEIGIGRTLTGTRAADSLTGGRFGDLIQGLSGADSLWGLGGDDTLLGGEGADLLRGGDGDDVLAGGRGNDRHWGGAGADVFVFGRLGGTDVVQDFDLAGADADRIALEGVTLRGWSERQMDGDGVLDTVLQLSSGSVVLLGTGDTDVDWRTALTGNPLAA